MANIVHTEAEALQCLALSQAGLSYSQIAHKLGLTKGKVTHLVSRGKLLTPPEFKINLGTPLTLIGDQMVVGDVHVPCTDYPFASWVLKVAQKQQIKSLVIAGDFFNFDAFDTKHPSMGTNITWAMERDAGRVLLREWLEWFDNITILMGNHDRRMQSYTEGAIGPDDIFGMLIQNPKIVTSNYSWCNVISGGISWRVTHPKNYSVDQLKVAADLALKFQTNILSFHEHHLSKGFDKFGRYVVINGGSLVDPCSLAYVQLEDCRAANMMRGFAWIKNGAGYVFGQHPFSDMQEG